MLHIKRNGITNAASWLQIISLQTLYELRGWGQNIKIYGHGANQVKGNDLCCNMVGTIFFPANPMQYCGWGQNSTLLAHCHVANQIKSESRIQKHGLTPWID